MTLYQQKAIKTGRMGHQDAKLTSMRPRLKELNDIPYDRLYCPVGVELHFLYAHLSVVIVKEA